MTRRPDGIGAALSFVVLGVVVAFVAFVPWLVSWVMMSIFFAILIWPFHTWLLRRRLPFGVALLLDALLLIGVITALATLIGVSISQMIANAPTYQSGLSAHMAETRAMIDALGMPLLSRALFDVVNPGQLVGLFVTILSAIGGLVLNFFYMLLLVVFLLVDGPGMIGRVRTGLGEDHPLAVRLSLLGPKVIQIFGIRAYVNLLTGVGVGIGLWLMGIDYALLWGTLLFFLSFIPYIGIFVASIPPFLLALAEFGPGRALLVIVCITVVNLGLENIVMPRMVGARLSITPTVSVVSFVFWTWLLGAGGAVLALFLTMLTITILDSFEQTRWIAGVMTEGSLAPADAVTPAPAPAAIDGQIPA